MPTNNNSTIIESGIGTKLTNLNNYLTQYQDLTCYIKFTVNNFILDTRSLNSFEHYAISLENQKTGAGTGNQFTLTIAFNPYYNANGTDSNINSFEQNLSTFDTNPDQRNYCTLEYGYITQNGIVLDNYIGYGMLLKYSMTANSQIVEYKLEGYTGEQISALRVNWYPQIAESSLENAKEQREQIGDVYYLIVEPNDATSDDANEQSALSNLSTDEIIQRIESLGIQGFVMNPYKALKQFITEYNDSIEISGNNINNYTTFEIGYGTKGTAENDKLDENYLIQNLKNVQISPCRSQSPIEYMQYLIGLFSEEIDPLENYKANNSNISPRYTYEFKQENTDDNTITVVVNRLDPQQDYADYTFNLYTSDNKLLINYNLEYDGTIALTAKTSIDSVNNDNTEPTIYIDETGMIKQQAVLTGSSLVNGNVTDVLVGEANVWLDNISISNKCTLTTVGLPFEVPINSRFYVNIYIGNTLHHTSGSCLTLGCVDRINNGRFTTEISAIRLQGKSNGVIT